MLKATFLFVEIFWAKNNFVSNKQKSTQWWAWIFYKWTIKTEEKLHAKDSFYSVYKWFTQVEKSEHLENNNVNFYPRKQETSQIKMKELCLITNKFANAHKYRQTQTVYYANELLDNWLMLLTQWDIFVQSNEKKTLKKTYIKMKSWHY